LLLALLAAPAALVAQQVPDGSVREGTLSFDAKATAGDFTGTTRTVTGEMTGGELTAVRGWVEAPTKSLITGKGKRDRDLNKSMESEKYPTIRFELDGVTPGAPRGDSLGVVLKGRFTLHGVTREAEFPAVVLLRPDAVQVRAKTPVNLKDYKIGGLSRAFGMLRMHEEILVRVDLTFAPSEKRVN
ncbi:MAG TPA: YceI family protein, partial [Gemmatimonadales bacterium]|nr:YceI family protein [Gemmatimonadales bacterium]